MNKLVIGLAVAFLLISGMNLIARPLESATPAIVNPTGWDKPTIWKHLDDIIKTTQDENVSKVKLILKINSKVCDLPNGIWQQLSDYAWTGDKNSPVELAKLIKLTCENWKAILGWAGAK